MAKFGYYLAERLHQQGLLQALVVHSKGKFTTPFPSVPVSSLSRYYLKVINAAGPALKMPGHKQRLLQEQLFDWFCSRRITRETGLLLVTQPFLYRTFQKARKMGIPIVFIPGTAEENFIYQIVSVEQKLTGIKGEDAYTDQKRLGFYNRSINLVDTVAAPFSVIYDSYVASGYKGETKSLLGYLKPEIKEGTKKNDQIFRVGYLAHTVLLKGLHYLLEAWKQIQDEGLLKPDMELHITGGMDRDMETYVQSHFSGLRQVTYTGRISDVGSFYKSLSLFVVPSLTDGAPYTAMEAAMMGAPVVLTENCGTKTFLTGEQPGCFTIPIRDAGAIKHHILSAYQNPEAYQAIGKQGKALIDAYNPESYILSMCDYLSSRL